MPRNLTSGDHISDHYKIEEYIDEVEGSVARVYGAQQLQGAERQVAFKVLRPEHLDLPEKERIEKYEAFNREAELLYLLRNDDRVMDLFEVGYLWETAKRGSHQYNNRSLGLNVQQFRALQWEAMSWGWRPYLALRRYPWSNSLQYLLSKKGRQVRLPMVEAIDLSLQLIDLIVKLHNDVELHPETIVYWDAKPAHAFWDGQKMTLIDWNVSYPLTPENRRRAGGGNPDELKELDLLILGRKLIYPAFIGREFQGNPVESKGTPYGNIVRDLHAFNYHGDVSLHGYEEKLDVPVRNFLTRVVQSHRFRNAEQLQESLQHCAIQLGWQFGDQKPDNGLVRSLEQKRKVIDHLRTVHQALESALQELRQFERDFPGEDTRYLSQKVRELFKSSDIP